METAYTYLALSGLLTILLWTPYILARLFTWGLPTFLNNYPEGFPAKQPEPPLWAQRAQRAHLNMVETMPAFIAVVLAAAYFAQTKAGIGAVVGQWAMIFFIALSSLHVWPMRLSTSSAFLTFAPLFIWCLGWPS